MTEKTLDEMKAEMRKDVELMLSGNHPTKKAEGVMFIDGYDNCINESRRGLSKLPLVDPKDIEYCPESRMRLLIITIINDEVVGASMRYNRKWSAAATQIPTAVQKLKLFLFIPVSQGEKVEMVFAHSEEAARTIHKEKVKDPVCYDVVTEVDIPSTPSHVDYQTRFDDDSE